MRVLSCGPSVVVGAAYTLGMPTPANTDPADVRDRVEKVLSAIRPAVQSDGGDVELVELTPDGVVRIRLHGACVGCPSSQMTLKMGIERNLRLHVPEVVRLEAIQ